MSSKLALATRSSESIYRETPEEKAPSSAEKGKLSQILGQINVQIRAHMVGVKIIEFNDAGKKVDLSEYSDLGMEIFDIFVEERCLDGICLNLKSFSPHLHKQIAERLIEMGVGFMVIDYLDHFFEVRRFDVIAGIEAYIKGGRSYSIEHLMRQRAEFGEGGVERLLKTMTVMGRGEVVLREINKGMGLDKVVIDEIAFLHMRKLGESVDNGQYVLIAGELIRFLNGRFK